MARNNFSSNPDNTIHSHSCVTNDLGIDLVIRDDIKLPLLQSVLNFYTSEIDRFNHWCKLNFLDLNVKKTKEMIIDFREKKPILEPIKINNSTVDNCENL